MVEHKTEEEQIEAVKRWWSENGRVVVIAVVIGVSGSFGWQFWQDYKQERREQAALEYWQFVEFLEKDFISIDVSRPDIIGDKIKSDFPKSNYSKFTAMHLAKIYVDAEKFDKAEDELRWVLRESGSADAISQVASIRLARVLAAMGESTKAIEILSSKGIKFTFALTVPESNILLCERIKKINNAGVIRIFNFGVVNYDQSRLIMNKSAHLVFPSLEESFGLPLLEAVFSNTKVIAAQLPYVNEVIDASLYFDPLNPIDISEKMLFSLKNNLELSKSRVENDVEKLINKLYKNV